MYRGLCICICIYNRQEFPIIDKDFSTDGLFFISFFAKGPGGVCIITTVCLSYLLTPLLFVSVSNVYSFKRPFSKQVLNSLKKEVILVAEVSQDFFILLFHSAMILHLCLIQW